MTHCWPEHGRVAWTLQMGPGESHEPLKAELSLASGRRGSQRDSKCEKHVIQAFLMTEAATGEGRQVALGAEAPCADSQSYLRRKCILPTPEEANPPPKSPHAASLATTLISAL